MNNTVGNVNSRLVKAFLYSSILWFLLSIIVGFIVSLKLIYPDFLGKTPCLTFGRLRFVHTNGVIFGWLTTAFFGTSENAVKTQVWIAITVYVLVAIIRKRFKIDISLYTILQIFSVTAFEKLPLYQVLTQKEPENISQQNHNQLQLFGF